jgi:hypothetical protein
MKLGTAPLGQFLFCKKLLEKAKVSFPSVSGVNCQKIHKTANFSQFVKM